MTASCHNISETRTTSNKTKKRIQTNRRRAIRSSHKPAQSTSEFHININLMQLNPSIIMPNVKFINEII